MNALAKSSFEPVGVEETHEELEIGFLAVVWRSRHQKKIASMSAEQFAELVALRFLDLAAEIRSGHPMRLVADHEIPIRRCFELGFQFVRPRGHIEPQDEAVLLDERIPGDRCFDLVARQEVEPETEFLGHFLLPLFDEAARRDDQATFQIATNE